tara:strand:+ start:157 stop:399 length:243 start_codon:yes stop_codon:yes gene_type:complete
MAKIDDLKKSVSDMTDEELMEALKTIRSNRRIPAKKASGKRKTTKKSKSKTINVEGLASGLSPEVAAALLKELEGGNDES